MKCAQKAPSFRIASYNIRKARGLDGKRDPGRIIDVINALDADVVVLQEADRRLGRRPTAVPREMIASATDFAVVPLAQNDVSLGWHGNAILVRRGLTFQDPQHLDLPGLEPRGAVSVKVDEKATVVGVHLGLTRSARRQQLEKIVRSLPQSATSIVIGDMNEWAKRRGFEPLERQFSLHSPGRSFHAARPVASLDRLALGKQYQLLAAGVDESMMACRASDHLPIWADVEMSIQLP